MKFNGRILVQKYSIQVYYIGVLSFEKGFIFLTYLSLAKQATKEFELDFL